MTKDFFSDERKIYDSVHGFIRLDTIEKELIESWPFQRLHHIRQLGGAFLVYPGATHTRFEHSLGVMELATRIYHNICKAVRPDVFAHVPRKGSVEYHYWRKVLRMSALCHDLGHLPFSHAAEKMFLGEKGHEYWTCRVIESPFIRPILEKAYVEAGFQELFPDRDFAQDVAKIAVGESSWKALGHKGLSTWEKIVSEVITGNFFGADRIDYLLRDAKSTGVAYGLFDYQQLIEMIRILPSVKGAHELALGINENGMESCEALLLARHFMHRRVYQYAGVKSFNFHLQNFMQTFTTKETFESVENYISLTDNTILHALETAYREKNHPGFADAGAILGRKNRYKALGVGKKLSEEHLASICKQANIPPKETYLESAATKNHEELLSFPVSRKHLMVEPAHKVSQLLFRFFSEANSWIYVPSENESRLRDALAIWSTKPHVF
ncbi:MAG: HD domain-containing protein [Chlamydiota bacterium]